MVISATTDETVILDQTRIQLGLPPGAVGIESDEFLSAALRRLAGIHCPCPLPTLAARLAESLFHLSKVRPADLRERAIEVLDRMVLQGDLLELHDVTTIDPTARGSWLFAAPPTFISRPDGSNLLLGLADDEATPLPAELASRITYRGVSRWLIAGADEALSTALKQFGMIELSEVAWLKPPRTETAEGFVEAFNQRLSAAGPSGEIRDLTILNPAKSPTYYKGRWGDPNDLTGRFVARRPQAYGSPIWGYAELANGQTLKFVDLPLKADRYRGCDTAWRLQAAIDHLRSQPQRYRLEQAEGGSNFHFFGPIPFWAERRFITLGRPAAVSQSLFAYWLPSAEVEKQSGFLQSYLWMSESVT